MALARLRSDTATCAPSKSCRAQAPCNHFLATFFRLHVAFAEALFYTRALCKYCSLPTRFYTSAAFVFGQLLSTYMALTLLRFDAAPH